MEEKVFVICFRPPMALICAGLKLCCSVIKRNDEYVFFMTGTVLHGAVGLSLLFVHDALQ